MPSKLKSAAAIAAVIATPVATALAADRPGEPIRPRGGEAILRTPPVGGEPTVGEHMQALARRERRRAAARARERRAREGGRVRELPPVLESIAACESGGNPRAIGGGGTFRGKYQFDLGTWASVGGNGDPAAASEAEQDRRAAILYARGGASPWPVCGR